MDGKPRSRTYVRRQGRMTDAQRRHLQGDASAYRIAEEPRQIDLDAAFGRRAPLLVEIGFGMGHALVAAALANPDWSCLGIDVYRPGIGALLKELRAQDIANVRVIEGDAIDVLRHRLLPKSIDRLYVFFPDPWPKRRHLKRRLVDAELAALAADRLGVGAEWLLATDYEPYAAQMLAVLDSEPLLENIAGSGAFAARSSTRPQTRFESRGLRLGNVVRDLCYRRVEGRHDAVEES